MEQDGAWGDHLILCAAANCFETCIHVVSSLHNDVVIRPHSPVDESKPLVLGHIHEVHYVSLQPIQGKKRKISSSPSKITGMVSYLIVLIFNSGNEPNALIPSWHDTPVSLVTLSLL